MIMDNMDIINEKTQIKHTNASKLFTGKGIWLISLLLIFIAFFIINYLTPALADDFNYINYWNNIPDNKTGILNSFLNSVVSFYNSWGGRIMGYIFTVIFNTIPPVIFDLLNSVTYMFLVYLVYKVSNFGKLPDLKLFLFINIFIWLFVPDYGQIMFWTSGSANYLYPAVIDFLVLLIFRKYSFESGNCFKNILWLFPAFLFGIVAGCGMENISAGMIIILTLNMFIFIKKKIFLNPMVIGLYTGCITGYCILFFAPGNKARAEAENGKYNLGYIFKCFIAGYYWVFFGLVIFMVMAILLWLKYKKVIYINNENIIQSCFYYISSVLSALCLVAAPTIGERAWFISTVYGVTAAGILFASTEEYIKKKNIIIARDVLSIITACGCIFYMVSIADTSICSYELHTQFIQREKYIIEQKEAGNLDISVPVISYKYPFRSKHDALSGLTDIKEDSAYWVNQSMANHYGINSITGTDNK